MIELEFGGRLSDLTACLDEHTKEFNEIWFRGQSNYTHMLTPSIFRQGDKFGVKYDEFRMFNEFTRRYPNESNSHKNIVEWLTLMQHYGLPTRLLDWSSSLLVALYFCCSENIDQDGSIFVFDPKCLEMIELGELLEMQLKVKDRSDFYHYLIHKCKNEFDDDTLLNSVSFRDIKDNLFTQSRFFGLSTDSEEPFQNLQVKQMLPNAYTEDGQHVPFIYQDLLRCFSNIVAFRAPHLNPRIRQQHGYFTFHGGMYFDGKEFIKPDPLENHSFCQRKLLKIKVKAEDKAKLLSELRHMGIREATLFPEMEYQAREITNMFSERYS